MSGIKFGTDGVRGEYVSGETEEVAFRLGMAASDEFGGLPWVMVSDTRAFNPALAEAFKAGAAQFDSRVLDLGVLPTPAAALLAGDLTRREDMPHAAVSLSASHNPAGDFGVKIFLPGGSKPDDATFDRIAEKASSDQTSERLFPVKAVAGASRLDAELFRSKYLNMLVGTVDIGLRRDMFLSGERIVVDGANGAAHWSAPTILKALGAQVITVNCDPEAEINKNCGATHTESMIEAVRANRARYGISLDGDADRLMAFSTSGEAERELDGDDSLVIALKGLRASDRIYQPGIVITAYSNLGLERWAAEDGIQIVEVDNGDRFVVEGLLSAGFPAGGEQTGHTIYADTLNRRKHVLTGDGTLAALQQLQTAALLDKPLHEVSDWPKLPSKLTNIRLPKGTDAKKLTTQAEFMEAVSKANEAIGDGRIHVRPSGTEPVMRALVKGEDQQLVEEVSAALATSIQAVVG